MQLDPSVEKEHLFSNFSESVRTVAPGPITEPMGGGGEGTHAATSGAPGVRESDPEAENRKGCSPVGD